MFKFTLVKTIFSKIGLGITNTNFDFYLKTKFTIKESY